MRVLAMQALPRSYYDRDAAIVARDLLGKWLVHRTDGRMIIGRIVETEAYLGQRDLASHSSKGMTERNRTMFGPPGHAYVYLIYGVHHCMNVVTEGDGRASAVLIRALEPVLDLTTHTRGPGLLCKAMGIDRRLNGHDLLSDDFFVTESENPAKFTIVRRPRIGVDYAKHWAGRLLRFYIKNNPFVSRP